MKKFLIALLVFIAAYAVGAAVLAVANGQAEGKMLNAEKQLLADGNMEKSDTSAWSAVSGAVLSKQAGAAVDGARVLRVSYGSAVNPVAQQAPLTVGKKYRITGWTRSDGISYPAVSTGSYTWIWLFGTTSTDWQRIDAIWTASNTNVRLLALIGSAGYAEFDDMMITEYAGETVQQEKQILVDGNMEKSGTTAWSSGSGGVLTKESGMAVDGSRVLRIEAILGDAGGQAYQSSFTLGKRYRVAGWVRGDGVNGYLRIRGADGAVLWISTTSANWQRFDFIYLSTGPHIYFETYGNVVTSDYTEIDDVFINEYYGETVQQDLQILADGDMEEADTSSWGGCISCTQTKESGTAVDGTLVSRVTASGSAVPAIFKTIFTVGNRYKIEGWARTDSSRNIDISDRAGTSRCLNMTVGTDWVPFSCIFVSGNGDIRIGFVSSGAGQWAEFDDILATEL